MHGTGTSRGTRASSASSRGASTKTRSAPRPAKACARQRASPMPAVARASVRAMTRMSAAASRASTAARIRASASSRPTTSLPRVWPQRFGASWSSIITQAKPAAA